MTHGYRNNPDWLDSAVFYQIFPASYYDANGDGIGDLRGIIEKLDYIKELGCNAIWINPCFASPFADGGYDVADYYRVAPRYGSNDDMRDLFDEARKRGIRICLDLVPGHTSTDHPWFQESCKPHRNEYWNRYVWTDTVWGQLERDFVRGYSSRNACYMANFFYCQPALNYGYANPDPDKPWQLPWNHPDCLALRDEIKKIMRFWLDMGASGFRVDMPSSLVKEDPGFSVTSALWDEVRDMIDREYPDAVLISEWGNPVQAVSEAGFHIDFLLNVHTLAYNSLFRFEQDEFKFSDVTGPSFFRKEGRGDITLFLEDYVKWFELTRDHGFIGLVSGNHDLPRISLGRDQEDLKVAFAFILTMPGVPFIYYGDEIGISYNSDLDSKEGGFHRTGSRTPMQWSGKKNSGFSTAAEERLYLPVECGADAPCVENQRGVSDSLLETVKALVKLRKSEPALASQGSFRPIYAKSGECPFVYIRENGSSRFLIVVNPSNRSRSVDLDLPLQYVGANLPAIGSGSLVSHGNKTVLTVDAVSFGIYKLTDTSQNDDSPAKRELDAIIA